ncbi:MAG: 5-(carboxyamino)imidazole ribonucleotide mutase [Candidatus Omnitrophica bacterium]|nr:5-(carboxyamino)imidazole ribonucleotide mutase [Candidatus Omnitrophota bacterium]
MSKIAILMGSESDMPIVKHCVDTLDEFSIKYTVKVLSAHRTPDQTVKFAKHAEKSGIRVIIAAAGGAAHLAGVLAAHTTLPVIGIPIETQALGGIDSLFSVVQMPAGIPVACMAIGKSGAKNAAILAAQILALSDTKIKNKLKLHKKKLAGTSLRGSPKG